MTKVTAQKRLELVKKALRGESISKICKEEGLSRVIFYRWLANYKEKGEEGLATGSPGRPRIRSVKHIKEPSYVKLSPSARLSMVKEVLEQNQQASEVAKRYDISRITLYKWINRYKEDLRLGKIPELRPKVPFVEHYYHETPEKYQEAVLAMVAKHPEFGIRSIVASLPKVGSTPIVGHHGVQNILKRNGLLHFDERLIYAKSRETAVTSTIRKLLEPVFNFFKISQEKRAGIIQSGGTIALLSFLGIVILGASGFLAGNIFAATGLSKIGLFFARIISIATLIFIIGPIFIPDKYIPHPKQKTKKENIFKKKMNLLGEDENENY